MGRRVDRAALGAGYAALLYLFFLNAWKSIPLACAAAFVCCALTRRLIRGLPNAPRASMTQARAELMRVAALDEVEAEAALTALIARRWPGEAFQLAAVLKHPEATLSSGDVLNAWKANRDAQRLVVACTCPCEPRAMLYARELDSPPVALFDSRRLLRLLRACPAGELPPVPALSLRERTRRLLARAASARVSPKNALLALMMLAGYLFGGNPWYLLCALALLLHLGVALIQRRTGRGLFDA